MRIVSSKLHSEEERKTIYALVVEIGWLFKTRHTVYHIKRSYLSGEHAFDTTQSDSLNCTYKIEQLHAYNIIKYGSEEYE